MSQTKGKIIDHFYGGIIRDEKTRIDGAALNVEELDIFENANFVRAAQVMTRVAASSSSPSNSPSASDISGTGSPSASPSSSPSASATYGEIAYDAFTTGSEFTSTTSTSWSHTCTGENRLLIVSVYTGSYGTTGMSVTYGGVAMTLQETAQYSGGTAYVRTFVLANPIVGTNTIAVSWTGSSYGRGMSTSYTGVSQVTPIESSDSAASLSPYTNAYVTLNPTVTGSWWYGAMVGANTTAGQLTGYQSLTTVRGHVSDRLAVGDSNGDLTAGSQNGGFTSSANITNGVSGLIISPIIIDLGSASASSSPYVDMTYVGSVTGSRTTSGTLSLSLTSLSLQEGDLVIGIAGSGSDNAVVPTINSSGYTQIYSGFGNDTVDIGMYVGYKLMSSSPDTTFEVAGTGNNAYGSSAMVYVWRGVDQTTPLDATSTTTTGSNSSIPNPPSITPVTTGALVVAIGGSSYSRTPTAPSGYTNLVNVEAADTYEADLMVASKFWSGSGAEDPAAFGLSSGGTSHSWAAVTMALRPAGSDNSASNSPSSSVSSSPSASVFPQDQTEITAYTGDLNDNAWGYGGQADTNAAQIFRLQNAGSDTPGSFELVNISGDIVNEAFPQSPLQYHKTDEANAIYYLKKAGTDISLVRYDIDNDTEDVWTGSAWSAVPSSSPSPSPSASPSASAGESGDIPASSQLTGLTGTNDRYFMRVEFGELYIGNGNYIAKVDSEGTFIEKAFQLPLEWEAVDITFVSDVGLILARNINRKANYSKAFWWDLTSEVQFDNQITIPHGGPQWIVNFKERLYVLCAQNGVATFYSSVASPGVPLQKVPGMELANLAAETETQEISSPKMMAIKDGILYFGLYKTDKSGIYALGSLDEDKPTALILAKRFDTTDYSRHVPIALHTQGPNFYASYEDNGAFKHSRCESNNSPDRSSNAVYESVIFDEGDPTKNKDILGMYVMTKPLGSGTSVRAYIKSDYGDWTQVLQEDGITYSTATKLLGNFRGKSITGKTHQFKMELISSGATSPIVTGLAYVARVSDLPAYA